MSPGDKARKEQVWLATFSAAIAGYQPSSEIDELDDDAREQAYLDDVINYADNVADNSLRIFEETFMPKRGRARGRGSRDEEEEEGDDD